MASYSNIESQIRPGGHRNSRTAARQTSNHQLGPIEELPSDYANSDSSQHQSPKPCLGRETKRRYINPQKPRVRKMARGNKSIDVSSEPHGGSIHTSTDQSLSGLITPVSSTCLSSSSVERDAIPESGETLQHIEDRIPNDKTSEHYNNQTRVAQVDGPDIRILKNNLYSSTGREFNMKAYAKGFDRAIETQRLIAEELRNLSYKFEGYQCGPYMAGQRSSQTSKTVTLQPCVVVSCRDKKASRAFEKRLMELEWRKTDTSGGYFKSGLYSGIHVYYKGARLAASIPNGDFIEVPNLDQNGVSLFPDGKELHVHIEDYTSRGETATICGLVCCMTITDKGKIVYQNTSRIGGCLKILSRDDWLRIPGVTTGHAMLGDFPWLNVRDQDGISSHDDSDTDDSSSEEFNDDLQDRLGYINPESIKRWHAIKPTGTISFAQKTITSRVSDEKSFQGHMAADFALLPILEHKLPRNQRGYINSYIDQSGIRKDIMQSRNIPRSESSSASSPVAIILNHNKTAAEAQILPYESTIFVRGKELITNEIWLDKPLSPGVSGAWVAQGESLVGMLCAIFDEPRALIIPTASLFKDIELRARAKDVGIPEPRDIMQIESLAFSLDNIRSKADGMNIEEHLLKLQSSPENANAIAEVLCRQGKYEAAADLYSKILWLRRRVLGAEHRSTLSTMNSLALVLDNQGKYVEAKNLLDEVLYSRRRILGEEHPDTLTSMNNLALVLQHQDRDNEALEISQKALSALERSLGRVHPHTLISKSNLAVVLYKLGKDQDAERINRETLELRTLMLGDEHSETLTSAGNLAQVLCSQKKYNEAEEMHRKTLKLREKILSQEHPDTLMSIYSLAHLLQKRSFSRLSQKRGDEREEEARGLYERACEGFERVLGASHPTTVRCKEDYRLRFISSGKVKSKWDSI